MTLAEQNDLIVTLPTRATLAEARQSARRGQRTPFRHTAPRTEDGVEPPAAQQRPPPLD